MKCRAESNSTGPLVAAAVTTIAVLLPQPGLGQALEPAEARLTGDYRTEDGRLVVIGRSSSNLIYFEPGTGAVRVLERRDSAYVAGTGLLATDTVAFRLTFADSTRRERNGFRLRFRNGRTVTARRTPRYSTEKVRFRGDGADLAGTVFLPRVEPPWPGVVLVHGSGAQDRFGPFGYHWLVADGLARSGVAVLTYDKRGVGVSSGNWRSAGFRTLARDASAALAHLAERHDVDFVGLWGISQAGWVAARVTQGDPSPAFVALVSAAGAAVTPAEQNTYNVTAELRRMDVSGPTIEQVRRAWSLLYAAVRDSSRSTDGGTGSLAAMVHKLTRSGVPERLLPPAEVTRAESGYRPWYERLDLDFDPLPVWKTYRVPLLAVFGALDRSTPSRRVARELRRVRAGGARTEVRVYPGANHFLLEAREGGVDELPGLRRFVPDVFSLMATWMRSRGEPCEGTSTSDHTSLTCKPCEEGQ